MKEKQALEVKWLSPNLRKALYDFERSVIGEHHLSWLLSGMAPYDGLKTR